MIQLSNLALKHLVEELQALKNGFVNKIQTLDNGWIKIKVHTKEGGKDLVLAPNALFVAEYSIPAKMNPGGYSAFLKKYLFNQRVISIEQKGVDRIVVLEFPDYFLIVELFAKGNVVLVDKEMKIAKAMKREEWKDRKLEKGAEYKFPSSKGVNPLEADEKEFVSNLLENKKSAFGACVDLLNISPAILEKVFSDLNFDKTKNSVDLSENEAKKIFSGVKKAYSAKERTVFLSNNIIYSADLDIEKEEAFKNINSALNKLLVKDLATPEEDEKGKVRQSKRIADLNLKEAQIKKLESEVGKLKEKGDFIYLHYSKISEVLSAVKKGEVKGIPAKEICAKINSVEEIIDTVDLKNKKVTLKLN